MKIRLISDVHLEFGSFDLPVIEGEKDQVLCIAGDLNPAFCLHEKDKADKSTEAFFKTLQHRFKNIIYVSGNHEYYYGDVAKDDQKFKDISDNYGVVFLQGESIVIDGVTFIGATLWTDFDNQDPITMMEANRCMNDYNCIKDSSAVNRNDNYETYSWELHRFTANRALYIHDAHRKIIFEEIQIARLRDPEAKVVVMTHHAPHSLSIHENYRFSALNGAYYTDLEHELITYRPNLWMHGHVHNNFDYKIEETRIVCNPRGYHQYEENQEFNPEMILEV